MLQPRFLLSFLLASCVLSSDLDSKYQESNLISKTLETDFKLVMEVDFMPDGKDMLVTGQMSSDLPLDTGAIEIWNTDEWRKTKTITTDSSYNLWASFTSTSDEIIVLNAYGGISLWNLESGEKIKEIAESGEIYRLSRDIDYSSVSQFLAWGNHLGQLSLLDIRNSEEIQLLSLNDDDFSGWARIRFSHDEKYLVAIATRNDIQTDERLGSITYVFETQTMEPVISIPFDGENALDAAFLEENRILLVGNAGILEIRNLETGSIVQDFRGQLYSLNQEIEPVPGRNAFAIPVSRVKGPYSLSRMVSLWSPTVEGVLCTTGVMTGRISVNRDLDISPDGKTLIVPHDNKLSLWDIESCFDREISLL